MDAYLDVFAIEELRPCFEAFHKAKFGTEALFPKEGAGRQIKEVIEGMTIDMKISDGGGDDGDDDGGGKMPAK